VKIATMERLPARDAAVGMLEDPGPAACLFEGGPLRGVHSISGAAAALQASRMNADKPVGVRAYEA
jgi:hypothetical protein